EPRGAAESPAGGEIRYGFTSEPKTLDPLNPANTADGRSILFNVFEGLVKPNPQGLMEGAAAQEYRMEQDGLVYAFTLREGVFFHDGSALTPRDAVFSLETAIQAGLPGFGQIAGVEITGDREIRITLHAPDREFLPYLSVAMVPAHNADREKNPIGTGPFRIARYTPQQSLVMEKNPRYWQRGLPKLDRVTLVFLANSEALIPALHGGNIDAATVTGSIVEQLDPEGFDIIHHYSNAVQLLALNNAAPPLNDVRVRRALSYAVDVPQIIETAFYGRGEPSGSPLIPGLAHAYETALRSPYPADPEKARQLLADAGLAGGFPLEIAVPSNYSMHGHTAEVMVNQLAAVGIQARIKQLDWLAWLAGVYHDRNYQATVISIDAPNVSPRAFLSRYYSSAEDNFLNYTSPAFDAIYRAALAEPEGEKRTALYKEAQRQISGDAAGVYIQDIYDFKALVKGRYAGLRAYPLYVVDFSTLYQTP
ncbi:MAG: ABC transporter substrate-binding protein, partial [Treponema sp.]|nr:ABC transporter substrate-binding protein [Treponema sp.]